MEHSLASWLLFLTPVIAGKEENIMWGSVWIYVRRWGLMFAWNLNSSTVHTVGNEGSPNNWAGPFSGLNLLSRYIGIAFYSVLLIHWGGKAPLSSQPSTDMGSTGWDNGRGSDSRDVVLCFWIQSMFLGGKHPPIMLAVDRSQSTYDVTNPSFAAWLYLQGMQGGELCNIEIHRIETKLLMLFVSGLSPNPIAYMFFTIHANPDQSICTGCRVLCACDLGAHVFVTIWCVSIDDVLKYSGCEHHVFYFGLSSHGRVIVIRS